MRRPFLRPRAGFTLLEAMISTSLMLGILGLSAQLFRKQQSSLGTQAGRLDAQQTGHFSLGTLDREIRVAGVNVVDQQPILVQAAAMAITFNADLVTETLNEPGAVYYDPDADSAAAGVMRRTDRRLLATSSSVYYPDSTYMKAAGAKSNAETIAFWLSRDSTSSRSDEYILFRRVNAMPAHVVARNIIVGANDTVFQYFKADTTGTLYPVTAASLPLIHIATVHGSAADTGRYATVDSVRTVRVRMKTVYHDAKLGDVYRRMEMTIKLMNAGLIRRTTCGDPPTSVVPTATATAGNAGSSHPDSYVTLTWPKALDDGGAEKDVERYVVYRRLSSQTDYAEPVVSIPAGLIGGATQYSWIDTDVVPGQQWFYGVAAQDCSPSSAPVGSTATAVTVPPVNP